jgi:hypothetical protein
VVAGFDLTVVGSTPAVWDSSTVTGDDVSTFFTGGGWTPLVTLKNYGNTKSVNLEASEITVNNASQKIVFSVPYSKAYSALGIVDPGTWTLYATRTVGAVEEVAELETGNLKIQLHS